jgi:hypothetical protein
VFTDKLDMAIRFFACLIAMVIMEGNYLSNNEVFCKHYRRENMKNSREITNYFSSWMFLAKRLQERELGQRGLLLYDKKF